jgi:hypothetical protein
MVGNASFQLGELRRRELTAKCLAALLPELVPSESGFVSRCPRELQKLEDVLGCGVGIGQ